MTAERTLKSSEVRLLLGSMTIAQGLARTTVETKSQAAAHSLNRLSRSAGRVWRRFPAKNSEPTFPGAAVLPKRQSDLPAMPVRSPELVWRIEAEASEAERADRTLTMPGAASLQGARLIEDRAERLPAAAIAAQARLLDPALIDRVAEDVMGRFERRMRIERERRGV